MAVTGGTGGLGLLVASWMVASGAAGKVLLLARSGRAPGPESGDGTCDAWALLAR